jgi:succinate dehydrogenase membrane anchor subunit
MSLRTPLAQALNRGSAHDGVRHWWLQRVTAVALAPLCLWLTISLLALPSMSYQAVSAWIGSGMHPIWLALTAVLAAWHGWLGIQVVIEDYVRQPALKLLLLLLSTFVNALLAACAVYAVLRVSLRSAM